MRTYTLFQEYIWLVNTIYRAHKITFEEINRKWLETELSEGVSIARSTFNRHKDAIEDMFGIYIDCDKKDGFRYYIGNEEVLKENTIQNWMLSTLSVNAVLSESKVVSNRILLETIPSTGEALKLFIEAMKRSVRIIVKYRRYSSEYETSMKVEPYCIKLFNRRWYALVKSLKDENLFILAFDRIKGIELSTEKFILEKQFDANDWFSNSYGIFRDPDVEVEHIVIRAFGKEANYMRDLPIHHTQKEINTTEEYSDFELTLSPTTDFFTPLLARGCSIKILEPKWLADEIRDLHINAAQLYR